MSVRAFLISALVALAAAQSSVLTFTSVPSTITDGQPQTLTYTSNDLSSPVTILLRKGASTDLKTVQTLTTSATGGSYIWTPDTSLPNGANYALQITQGDQTNYFGPFSITGSTAVATTSTSSATSTTSATSSTSSSITSTSSTSSSSSTKIVTTTSSSSSSSSSSTSSSSSHSSTSSSTSTTSNSAPFQTSASATPSHGAAAAIATGGSSLALMLGALAAVAL